MIMLRNSELIVKIITISTFFQVTNQYKCNSDAIPLIRGLFLKIKSLKPSVRRAHVLKSKPISINTSLHSNTDPLF